MPKGYKKGASKNRQKVTKISDDFRACLEDKDIMLAIITKRCGGTHVDVICADDIPRKLYIRNSIKKRVWLNPDDVVFVSRRTDMSKDNKCDFIHKCNTNEKTFLKKNNKLKVFDSYEGINVFAEEDTKQIEEQKLRVSVVAPQTRYLGMPSENEELNKTPEKDSLDIDDL